VVYQKPAKEPDNNSSNDTLLSRKKDAG